MSFVESFAPSMIESTAAPPTAPLQPALPEPPDQLEFDLGNGPGVLGD